MGTSYFFLLLTSYFLLFNSSYFLLITLLICSLHSDYSIVKMPQSKRRAPSPPPSWGGKESRPLTAACRPRARPNAASESLLANQEPPTPWEASHAASRHPKYYPALPNQRAAMKKSVNNKKPVHHLHP